MTTLKIYKTHPEVFLPKFATEQAACFDIAAQYFGKQTYTGYNSQNAPFEGVISTHSGNQITIMPGDRVLVPTGLIFDIPKGYSVRIHPRSGLSYKQGIVLANLEAVIDSDYYQETFIILTNTSANKVRITHGDRIAQAELVKSISYTIEETKEKPKQRTDRVGGLGSTGVSANVKV
jgi:dUTP pyrophosphatase